MTGTAEHESALARDFVTLASFLDPRASITSQPVTITFRDGRRTRRYTPDFLMLWADCRKELVEVKYQSDLAANAVSLEAAFAAAGRWANEHGASFRTATENDIRGALLENAKRLLPFRRDVLDPAATVHALTVVASITVPTIASVVAALSTNRAHALATVWRLIAHGSLKVNVAVPMVMNTRVFIE